MVTEGKSGHLCRVGDVACMASFAISILTNEDSLKRYRAIAREEVLSRYDVEDVVVEYERYYEEILAQ